MRGCEHLPAGHLLLFSGDLFAHHNQAAREPITAA